MATKIFQVSQVLFLQGDFDVFAKGPDQTHAGFQRAVEWCKANGKDVVVIPRTEGISSTMLREYSKTR
jgi:glycerol-3-phosphate cytidylyltransferase-like family protein